MHDMSSACANEKRQQLVPERNAAVLTEPAELFSQGSIGEMAANAIPGAARYERQLKQKCIAYVIRMFNLADIRNLGIRTRWRIYDIEQLQTGFYYPSTP
jgi:hypothetical protein